MKSEVRGPKSEINTQSELCFPPAVRLTRFRIRISDFATSDFIGAFDAITFAVTATAAFAQSRKLKVIREHEAEAMRVHAVELHLV